MNSAGLHSETVALRTEICRVGQSLYARGYVHASAGNISARTPDGLLITPTDACLGTLTPQALALVTPGGRQLTGAPASKTLALHRRIYAAAPQARCIIHTHSRQLVALSLEGVWSQADILPPITPYFVMKVGHVPLIAYHRPGDSCVADRVQEHIEALGARGLTLRAVMLERLGPTVWHDSPAQASAVLEELEETAALWRSVSPRPAPLDAMQLAELRDTFGAQW